MIRMNESYLEVTFRHGRPVAAYYYLPRRPGQKSYRSQRIEPGMILDYSRSGQLIGIEITSPTKVTATALNRILRELGLPLIKKGDLAPLLAA
ncbi:MAG: DUF2283 domain-containing protein [Acidobacteriota bacterium]